MPIRVRNGKLQWRFWVNGHEYAEVTDLADTARNRITAQRKEAEARKLVMSGKEEELQTGIEPFTSAADKFIEFCEGEYRDHPNSWKRIRGSMTSAKEKWRRIPIHTIKKAELEDYKAWRRKQHDVRDVTLRHDFHALSLLFQYAMTHGWCHRNPVEDIEMPSDQDAMRTFVLSPEAEVAFFAAIDALIQEKSAAKRRLDVCALHDIRDLSTLMLNQGCRPEELRELPRDLVDMHRGLFTIARGKSKAARRTLPFAAESRFVFERRLRRLDTPWVFPSSRMPGKHIGQHQRMWGTVTKKAGLEKDLVMYDLRHTFATRAVERGIELPKLIAILGHANLRTIMRYVHMGQDHINDGMKRFDEMRLGPVVVRSNEEKGYEMGLDHTKSNLLQ